MDWVQYGALGVLAFAIYVWNKDSKEMLRCVIRAMQDNSQALTELKEAINRLDRVCPVKEREEVMRNEKRSA